jgi:competence protein ComEC
MVTGDAPTVEENIFVHEAKGLRDVRWLVLGHHGSRTSTSDNLLRSLPSLRLTIASARHAKYGHPHSEVLQRLRFYRVPVLSTEDWGSIEIEE